MTNASQNPAPAVGDFLPEFKLEDERGRRVALTTHTLGKAILLLFYPDSQKPACQQMLKAFAAAQARLEPLAHVFAISAQSVEVNAGTVMQHALPFRVLADPGGAVAQHYGVAHNLPGAPLDFLGSEAFTVFLADANRRVLRIETGFTEPAAVESILDALAAQAPGASDEAPIGAPILQVPRVFDEAFCQRLMEVYETQGNEAGGTAYTSRSGEKGTRLDPDLKIRRDHYVRDPALQEEIARRLKARVLPEISRAFFYRVTRFEEFRIACYQASDGGHFAPHRDNTTLSLAHRRFAMSLNLNTGDYEGGQLRFAEFGPQLYTPGRGDALVFSCSLLHQALPVTAGRRFVLLSFFFGDEAQQMRDQRESALAANRR